jgi:Tfp pilus assembly protein PilF
MMIDILLLVSTIALMILLESLFYTSNHAAVSNTKDAISRERSKIFGGASEGRNQKRIGGLTKTTIKKDQLITLALVYRDAGELHQALEACNKVVHIDSTDEKGYFLRAMLYTQLGKNLEAINDYTKAIQLNPKHFQAYLNRSELCIKLNKPADAFFDFTKAARMNPLKACSFLISHSIQSIF